MISRLITYIIMLNWSFTKGIWELRCLWWVYTFSHFWQFMSLLCLSMQLFGYWVQLSYKISRYDSIMDMNMFKMSFQYMTCDLWSIMMFLWDFTFIATIANVWELWCLIDFYWDYDDANERYDIESLFLTFEKGMKPYWIPCDH